MSLSDWRSSDVTAISETDRAVSIWRMISRKPTVISIQRRDGTAVADQTVRIEYEQRQIERGGMLTTAERNKTTVFGVRNHPTIADTDIQEGDVFAYQNADYVVMSISWYSGEVQALCEQRN